ncbi:MAG: NADP-dependent oxidoreductase [Acetobacteraceae bacterium]|nr:NADP-dependent oxidoreductase [Acetobacteraceae bacterium]
MFNLAPGLRRSIVLRKRPTEAPKPDDFAIHDDLIPEPEPGQVVTRTIWLSIDPYMRGRMNEAKSYAAPVQLGDVMTGETIGEVIASKSPDFAPGDIVVGSRGWQTHSVTEADQLAKLNRKGPPLSTYLGVLGMPGVTAYSGMKDIGQPKKGETVVITAASGAVGSVAGQIAKREGARVVGVAGGPEKCLFAQETLGFDECIDYQASNIWSALADACPNGIDVYFENVGGETQHAAFSLLNTFSRVVMCGMVAQYNVRQVPPGPNLMFVVGKRVRIQGMIVSDKPERFAEWRALAAPWVLDGSLRHREHIIDGLESAPGALADVLAGRNFGKMLIRVGPDPA